MDKPKNERLEDEVNRGRIRTGVLTGGLALCVGTLLAVLSEASADENNMLAAAISGTGAAISYGIGYYLCHAAYSIWRGYKDSDFDKEETKH
jgi:hypothetical protein